MPVSRVETVDKPSLRKISGLVDSMSDAPLEPEYFVNPTGGRIRNDKNGLGHFRAPRRNSKGVPYDHQGVDLLSEVGNTVVAPIDGICSVLSRSVKIKLDKRWNGIDEVRLCYVKGYPDLHGKYVIAGQVIGTTMDLKDIYPNTPMKNHVHFEAYQIDENMDEDDPDNKTYFDPAKFIRPKLE